MRKPYCKMSLKDLLEQLHAMSQAEEEPDHPIDRDPGSSSIQPIPTNPRVQLDAETQAFAILQGGRRPGCKN